MRITPTIVISQWPPLAAWDSRARLAADGSTPADPCRRWRAAAATPRDSPTARRPEGRRGLLPWQRPAIAAPSTAGRSAPTALALSSGRDAWSRGYNGVLKPIASTGFVASLLRRLLPACRRALSPGFAEPRTREVKPAPSERRRRRSGGAGSCARRRATPSTRAAHRSLLAPARCTQDVF